jgi:hypothetical protein
LKLPAHRFGFAPSGGASVFHAVGVVVLLASALAAPSLPANVDPEASAPPQQLRQVRYNGAFTFTRISYGSPGYGRFGRNRGGGSWNHDYPNADQNMQFILEEFTAMHPNTRGSNVFDLEDREIFQSPILYLSEPGTWGITEEGARNLREYLLKGGFIIFDDFDGYGHWESWESQIKLALPEYEPIEIDGTHPIFDTFFYVPDIYIAHPMIGARPTYLGIFEDNDPSKRMLAMINWNQDLGEFWEYAATGFFPVDPTNDAFRLGVNYIIWGLTR